MALSELLLFPAIVNLLLTLREHIDVVRHAVIAKAAAKG